MDHPLNFNGFEIFEYRLPFERPFVVCDQLLATREGLILRLLSEDGLCGVGEVAPLPGLSEESLKKSLFQLRSLRQQLFSVRVPENLTEFKEMFTRDPFNCLCPSVRFGVEMAVLYLMAHAHKVLPAEILGCASISDIPVAGLVQGTPVEIKSQVGRLIDQGFTVFKLKVGSKNIPLDVKKVHLVRELIGPDRKFRLDANRAWSLLEAVAFCRNAGREGIEFIEEPLKDICELANFIREVAFPVALDESLDHCDPEKFVFTPGVEFIVIKPTIVGGIIKVLEWITRAQKDHKGIIISSVFESGVAGRMLANLAAFSPLAAGLGTDSWLAQDLLSPLRANGCDQISKKSLQFHWEDINMNALTPVKDK